MHTALHSQDEHMYVKFCTIGNLGYSCQMNVMNGPRGMDLGQDFVEHKALCFKMQLCLRHTVVFILVKHSCVDCTGVTLFCCGFLKKHYAVFFSVVMSVALSAEFIALFLIGRWSFSG